MIWSDSFIYSSGILLIDNSSLHVSQSEMKNKDCWLTSQSHCLGQHWVDTHRFSWYKCCCSATRLQSLPGWWWWTSQVPDELASSNLVHWLTFLVCVCIVKLILLLRILYQFNFKFTFPTGIVMRNQMNILVFEKYNIKH